jgi:predicted transcriptional regulator
MPRQNKKYKDIPYSDTLIENYLKLIKENPRLTSREIAEKLNCSYQTIKNLRSHLIKAKIMPHSLTPKEEYPEEEEEEDYKDEIIEKLKDENETLKSIINQLTSENSFLKTQLKVNETTKKNELELSKELTQLKVKVLEYELKEIEAILKNNDDNKMYNYLSAIKWSKKNELRKLENELSQMSA